MPAIVCACVGDTNGDGCTCADVDASNSVTIDDIAVFVADLLSGAGCPSSASI